MNREKSVWYPQSAAEGFTVALLGMVILLAVLSGCSA